MTGAGVGRAERMAVVLLAALCLGCGTASTPTPGAPSSAAESGAGSVVDESAALDATADESAANGTSSPSSETGPVTARIASWDETQQLVTQQTGKVVVLDLWSTACAPCIREFPRLVELQQKHPDGVVCISFNLNFAGLPGESPESIRDKVLPFLKEQQAAIINVVSSETDEQIYQRLDLAAIPAVYVYDRQGQLSRRFDNEQASSADDEFTYQKDIFPHVDSLLAGTE